MGVHENICNKNCFALLWWFDCLEYIKNLSEIKGALTAFLNYILLCKVNLINYLKQIGEGASALVQFLLCFLALKYFNIINFHNLQSEINYSKAKRHVRCRSYLFVSWSWFCHECMMKKDVRSAPQNKNACANIKHSRYFHY